LENKGGAEDEERENPNRKSIHAVRKEECRAKNERGLSKNRPESGSKWGKVGKTEISGRKRWGGVEAEKWALLPILQYYEMAKWVQMKFSRIFFR